MPAIALQLIRTIANSSPDRDQKAKEPMYNNRRTASRFLHKAGLKPDHPERLQPSRNITLPYLLNMLAAPGKNP